MKIDFEGTVEEFTKLISGDSIDTNIAVIQLDKDTYTRFFDPTNKLWTKEIGMNMYTLKRQQKYMYDLLMTRGYLFLNEALDMLGFSRTKNGQLVGWIYKEGIATNDIYTIYPHGNSGSLYMLNFNPQGIILDQI